MRPQREFAAQSSTAAATLPIMQELVEWRQEMNWCITIHQCNFPVWRFCEFCENTTSTNFKLIQHVHQDSIIMQRLPLERLRHFDGHNVNFMKEVSRFFLPLHLNWVATLQATCLATELPDTFACQPFGLSIDCSVRKTHTEGERERERVYNKQRIRIRIFSSPWASSPWKLNIQKPTLSSLLVNSQKFKNNHNKINDDTKQFPHGLSKNCF